MTNTLVLNVITVVRNGAQHLEATIQSVLRQQHVPMEYIVIDGASTDGTTEIISRYADRIAYWSSEPDRGIYDAMNKGWSVAQSNSLILFLGAGDQLISFPDSDNHYPADTVLYGTVQTGEREFFVPKADWRLRFYNSLHHQGLLVPKSLHPAPPFDCSFPRYADFDFNQRLYSQGASFRFLPGFRSLAMPGGITSSFAFRESLDVIRKNYGLLQMGLTFMTFAISRVFPQLRRFSHHTS
jgi:glycosyltransferase involved in cell wall biosynthesis